MADDGLQAAFEQEPLRMLAVLRDAAESGRRIDDATLDALRAAAPKLRDMPVHQAFSDLDRILVGVFAGQTVLDAHEVLATVIPELAPMAGCPQNTPYHIYDVLEHTAGVIDASPATSISRWAALFHDVGKPGCRRVDAAGRDHFKGHARTGAEIARSALERLEAPTRLIDDVYKLIYLHEWFPAETDEGIASAIEVLDGRVELYRALLALQVADSCAKAPISTERGDAARRLQARLEHWEDGSQD